MWRDLPKTKQRELHQLSSGAHQWRQARQQIIEAMIQHAEARQQAMEADPFAVRKDGRGSDRGSEDQAPATSSDIPELLPVLTQMKHLADEQTQQERTQAQEQA